MTPPPQDTLVSRKLMTGFARDFTGRECTEMSFGMSCISGVPKEKIRSSTTTWTSSHPSSYSSFPELISLGDFKVCSWKQMDNSLHGLLNAICITKALPTAEVDEIAKFLLEEIVLRHGAPQ
ncbi:hypothetical protein TNCV_642011 [Trichonephila clavipes]|nr:hypothetical protein TNCV_642011 [Trichonephila clavipes]